MSSKVKRKVTVEHGKDNSDHVRRPSVFERLGPGTINQPQERHSRSDQNEKCRNWLRSGSCSFGNTCRYEHDPFPAKHKSKDVDKKDLRHKVQKQHEEEPRTSSVSTKKKGEKRTTSTTRKTEHEGSKIKSTVVVTRPRTPPPIAEPAEKEKQKSEGAYEDDSDDWPVDESQLDYKEELTLERKRQQLQRELALELQKERLMNKNASVSDSSSSSSSSDSGSISSSSESSSSSSEDDSDNSSSSSSSSSSSASQQPKKYKKSVSKKETTKGNEAQVAPRKKPLEHYDKIKSSRSVKSSSTKVHSPPNAEVVKKRGREKKSPPSSSAAKKHHSQDMTSKTSSASGHAAPRGPRTPSPPPTTQKQRQWGQSSSADSRSADARKSRNKKHKRKKETSRTEHYKTDYVPTPPRLSSPNRTVLQQQQPLHIQSNKKKSWAKEDSSKYGHRNKEEPMPHQRAPSDRHGFFNPDTVDKSSKSKYYGRKADDVSSKKDSGSNSSRDKNPKRSGRMSTTNDSNSPPLSYHEGDPSERRKSYPLQFPDKSRRRSTSPSRKSKGHKKSVDEPLLKRRDDGHKDEHHRGDGHSRKEDQRNKSGAGASEGKKSRDNNGGKDRSHKERLMDEESWEDDHKKSSRGGRLESQVSSSKSERSRDRKKGIDCDFKDDMERDRMRLTPIRGSDLLPHHSSMKDDPSVSSSRSHLYDSELPEDREYSSYHYSYDDRVLPPDYDSDLLRGSSLYPPPDASDYPPIVYSDTRYRRDGAHKDAEHMDRMVSYGTREISPLDPPVREDDYLADLSIDERRNYDERWSRNRPLREEWEAYSPLPQSTLPFHMVSGLDEDRYGMPRRRRASPDWHLRRNDDRELSLREPRSRSPQHRRNIEDTSGPNRTTWRDQPDRREIRTDIQPKLHDDRKNRNNNRRDRRDGDRSAQRSVESPNLDPAPAKTSQSSTKDKASSKRSRSSTPAKKDAKRRREDVPPAKDNNSNQDKGSRKSKTESNNKDDSKSRSSKSSSKPSKTKSISPKPDEKPSGTDKAPSSRSSDKSDSAPTSVVSKTTAKTSTRTETEEKKKRSNASKPQAEDEFSDWSEGDDDLLNRDLESSNADARSKSDDHKKEKSSADKSSKQKRDGSRDSRNSRINELKSESKSRPASKERDNSETSRKNEGSVPSAKGSDSQEAFVIKDEDVNVEDFTMTESVDYDPISDEELETMIEEPQDLPHAKSASNDETKVIDALEVNWSDLVSDSHQPQFIAGNARKRFKAAHVLSRIGFSKAFAGAEMTEKITKFCQQQLDDEKEEENPTFHLEHDVPAFHKALAERKKQRLNAFKDVGTNRRALCARQDLRMRNFICRPFQKLVMASSGTCMQQFNIVDSEADIKMETHQPKIINMTC